MRKLGDVNRNAIDAQLHEHPRGDILGWQTGLRIEPILEAAVVVRSPPGHDLSRIEQPRRCSSLARPGSAGADAPVWWRLGRGGYTVAIVRAASVLNADTPLIEPEHAEQCEDAATTNPFASSTRTRLSPSAAVARGALALLSTQPLTWSATLLTTIFAPRFLGAEGYGQYAIAMTIAGLAGVVATLGVPGYLTRQIARNPSRASVEASGTLLLLTTVAIVVAAVVVAIVSVLGSPISEPNAIRLAVIGMVVLTAQQALYAYLIGQERHSAYAWLNAAWVAVSAVTGVAVLVAGGGLLAYLAAAIVATMATTGLLWYVSGLKISVRSFDLHLWQQLARGGLAFLGFNLAMRVRNQIDVLVIGLLLSEQAAGWLAAAYRIVWIPVFIPTLITTPLVPALSRSVDDPAAFRRTLQQSLTIALFLSVGASALIIGTAPAVPALLGWGASFDRSIPLMTILAVGEPFGAVDIILGGALLALNRERGWLRVTVLACVLNPVLNLVTIPLFETWLQHGAIGAAIVEVATELVMFAGALRLMPKGMIDQSIIWLGARILIAGVGLAVTARLILTSADLLVAFPCAVIGGGLTFLAISIALRVVKPGELWAGRHDGLRLLTSRIAA